jgi:hypothetical protein
MPDASVLPPGQNSSESIDTGILDLSQNEYRKNAHRRHSPD